ncbi:MAG: hypothetical protein J5935_05510 [Lachnospiraceae bacterium]|nr:hypothetical protein [Lachnospiraceae bacterium]
MKGDGKAGGYTKTVYAFFVGFSGRIGIFRFSIGKPAESDSAFLPIDFSAGTKDNTSYPVRSSQGGWISSHPKTPERRYILCLQIKSHLASLRWER